MWLAQEQQLQALEQQAELGRSHYQYCRDLTNQRHTFQGEFHHNVCQQQYGGNLPR